MKIELMDKELEEKLNTIEEDLKTVKKDVGEMKIDLGANKTNILVGFGNATKERVRIEAKIDKTYNAVDGFTKIVTKLQDEFTAMKEDLKRVKLVIKEKLGVDLT